MNALYTLLCGALGVLAALICLHHHIGLPVAILIGFAVAAAVRFIPLLWDLVAEVLD